MAFNGAVVIAPWYALDTGATGNGLARWMKESLSVIMLYRSQHYLSQGSKHQKKNVKSPQVVDGCY